MLDGLDLTCSDDDPCVVVPSSVRCSCFNGENLAVPKSKERAVEQRRPEATGCDDAESDSPSCHADSAECVSGTCFLVIDDIDGVEHSPIDEDQCVAPE
jgi:hypothetical protein